MSVVLITGAATGIGNITAKKLAGMPGRRDRRIGAKADAPRREMRRSGDHPPQRS
jgi:NADP-dependent 3-hydroxy acid dehydrogenase YdfG